MIAKYICVEESDSWRHTTMLAVLDKLEDSNPVIAEAWGEVFSFRQLRDIDLLNITIYTPWAPRLPKHLFVSDSWTVHKRPPKLALDVGLRIVVDPTRR